MAEPEGVSEAGGAAEKVRVPGVIVDGLNDIKPGLGTILEGVGGGPAGLVIAGILIGKQLKERIDAYNQSLDEAGAKAAQSPGHNSENLEQAWDETLTQAAKYKAQHNDPNNPLAKVAPGQAKDDSAVTAAEKPKAVADAKLASIRQEAESLKAQLPDLQKAADAADQQYQDKVTQLQNGAAFAIQQAENTGGPEAAKAISEINTLLARDVAAAKAKYQEGIAPLNNTEARLKQIEPGGNVYDRTLDNAAMADQRFNDTIGLSSASRSLGNNPTEANAATVESAIQTLQQSFQTYHQTILDGLKQLNAEVQQFTTEIRAEIQTIQHQQSNHGP